MREGATALSQREERRVLFLPGALAGMAGFGCPPERKKWYGMAQRGPFWDHK